MRQKEKKNSKWSKKRKENLTFILIVVILLVIVIGSPDYYIYSLSFFFSLSLFLVGFILYFVISFIKGKIDHKKNYEQSRAYRYKYDKEQKRKEKERRIKMKKTTRSQRIKEIILIVASSGFLILFASLFLFQQFRQYPYLLDAPLYFQKDYEATIGICQEVELVEVSKGRDYTRIIVDNIEYIAEPYVDVNAGDLITIEYLPHSRYIVDLGEISYYQ